MVDNSIDYINRDEIIQKIKQEFVVYDHNYLDNRAAIKSELADLREQVLQIQRGGNPLYRSEQILSEANWLANYTSEWDRLHRRLHALRLSLSPTTKQEDDDQRKLVAGPDGAFGLGATEWFIKWNATTEAIQGNVSVTKPLVFLKPILSPGRLLAYLHRLQTSHIAETGSNHRAELASVESSMLQFLVKPKMRKYLADPALWQGLQPADIERQLTTITETYVDFLDQTQHPRTGFWGPWYIVAGELIKMQDLSYTFHIINFRKGHVDRWPEIISTTLEIGRLNLDYPYGWKPAGSPSKYSNHHNTDIVTILRAGDQHATVEQRREIAGAVFDMLDWCLMESLRKDDQGNAYGDFQELDEIDTIDRYAFGIKFLDGVGYWSADDFWWNEEQERDERWPDFRVVARALIAAVRRLKSDSSYVADIEALLAPLAGA